MGEDTLFGCMSYDVFPVLGQSDGGKRARPGCSWKSILYQWPLECQPAFSWMNAVPRPLSCSRTCRAKESQGKDRGHATVLQTQIITQAGTKPWVQSQLCVFCAECLTLEVVSLAVSEEETPLSLHNAWTSGHPPSLRGRASLPPSCLQTRWPNTQAPDWAQSQLHSATRKQSQTSSVSATVQQ